MEYENLEHVEDFVEDVLDVLDLGNTDGGYGPTVYTLSNLQGERAEQLQKIYDLVKKYFS